MNKVYFWLLHIYINIVCSYKLTMSEHQTKFRADRRLITNVCKYIRKGNIDLNPSWQRNVVWNKRMKTELILSILKGFPINPVIFWDINGNQEVCVDGKNRLSAIYEFVNNVFSVRFNNTDVTYDELSEDIKDRFDEETIDIRVLIGRYWTEEKVREYFQVIQGGCKLTWPEKINSFHSKFVDFMRDIMCKTQDDFQKVLGADCNQRFELYNIIANILSVHPLVYSKYKTDKTKKRTADTNKSLMKYVVNTEDINFTESERETLLEYVRRTILLVRELHVMQNTKYVPQKKSIWFLQTKDTTSSRPKPGIRDFTSIAFYIIENERKTTTQLSIELQTIFERFVDIVVNHNEDCKEAFDSKRLQLVRDYYMEYGKNQKQYAWTSVSTRYDIMKEFLSIDT